MRKIHFLLAVAFVAAIGGAWLNYAVHLRLENHIPVEDNVPYYWGAFFASFALVSSEFNVLLSEGVSITTRLLAVEMMAIGLYWLNLSVKALLLCM